MIERKENPQVQKIIEWRETLSGMENQQFFSLIHLYLGEVKTPYNKQNLIEQLSSFIRKEENQNLIFNLLSENEILILNAIYFMKTVIRIYSPVENEQPISLKIKNPVYVVSIVFFVILNVVLGMWSTTIVSLIESGLGMFR